MQRSSGIIRVLTLTYFVKVALYIRTGHRLFWDQQVLVVNTYPQDMSGRKLF